MSILKQIVDTKKAEVAEKKTLYPTKLLERSLYFTTPTVSLKKYLTAPEKSGVIAEIKRRSPSSGLINGYVSVERVSIGYMQAGASALSILTDNKYFSGSSEDLQTARKFNYCPILRKEFIIDEYQILEARAIGADAILLIAAILSKEEISRLTSLAHSLNMEVLFEIHNRDEISSVAADTDVIGVNNRNLSTFKTTIENSLEIFPHLPSGMIKISESGIDSPETAILLSKHGYHGFLIGEHFMKHSRPEDSCASFIKKFQSLQYED